MTSKPNTVIIAFNHIVFHPGALAWDRIRLKEFHERMNGAKIPADFYMTRRENDKPWATFAK